MFTIASWSKEVVLEGESEENGGNCGLPRGMLA